ncbi:MULTISPECIES: MAPEG family protein [Microbulbifer]|uniref:MAPEG family protein n=1 Tax=Microbulbifer TaxID=48073 RepID=UPI001E4E812C|nr:MULTISPECIES: MAPEG family protein [Microbulbifer]UHQ55459.1 MAPEG family protein [Microbulbifer sp. YPW16]
MMVPLTGLYGGLCALLILALAFRVVRFRRGEKVGVGSGGKHYAEVLIRTHANAVEYVPIALLMMLVAEINGLSAFWLNILGGLLVLGRFLHAWGLTAGRGGYHYGRFWGTTLTWIVITAYASINIIGAF